MPDENISGSTVMILGQNPGAAEETHGRPFVGDTGEKMQRDFFPLAGLRRGINVSLGNTIRCRLQHSNRMPDGADWERAVDHCTKAHFNPPGSTKLIVAQGAHAWRALGGPQPLHDWRGYLKPAGMWVPPRFRMVSSVPQLATYHLSESAAHEPYIRQFTIPRDWVRIRRYLDGSWPLPDPSFCVADDLSLEAAAIIRSLKDRPFVVVDAEWPTKEGKKVGPLTLLGLGYPGDKLLSCRNPRRDGLLFSKVGDLLRHKPTVFHNAKADVPVLREDLGLSWVDFQGGIQDTMQAHHKLWCEHPHSLEYCASIYGRHNKIKHLSETHPFLYNAGDVSETGYLWLALEKEFTRDKVSYQAYLDDMEVLPHVDECETVGLGLDQCAITRGIDEASRDVDVARDIGKAWAGFSINIGSDDQVRYQLNDVDGFTPIKKKSTTKATVDKDAIAHLRATILPFDPKVDISIPLVLDRIEQGAHPFLEARALWSASDFVVTHYLRPLQRLQRAHVNCNVHAQNNHRWSWVDPALATFPYRLRSIFVPDLSWPWLEFDYDGIEIRIIACEASSAYLLDSVRNSHDLHTLTTCDIFRLPVPPNKVDPHKSPECIAWRQQVDWKGKDDVRRVFAKTFRYRLNYGGDPRFCGDVPGARTLALDERKLVEAAMSIKQRDPDLARWWRTTEATALATAMARDWRGRLRRFHTADLEELVRQAYDFGMQAGVQSHATLVLNQLKREFGDQIILKYGMHDSMKLAIREDVYDQILPRVKHIVQQPRTINGIEMPFPATFSPKRSYVQSEVQIVQQI